MAYKSLHTKKEVGRTSNPQQHKSTSYESALKSLNATTQLLPKHSLEGNRIQLLGSNPVQMKELQRFRENTSNGATPKHLNPVQAFGLKDTPTQETPIKHWTPEVFQRQQKENKTGLPDNLKSGVENLSGMSMDDVKVHYNSSKPSQLQAHAYAQGTDIHVASGQEKHLPHEAWHVVQQKQRRVKPTMQMQGVNVNDDTGLEREADVMGGKALQMKANSSSLNKQLNIHSDKTTIQRYIKVNKEAGKDTSEVKDGKSFTVNRETEDVFSSQVLGEDRDYKTIVHRSGDIGVGVNIANTGDLAVEDSAQPKNYFATSEKIAESNRILLAAHSAYEMIQQGQSITISIGDTKYTLYKVYPKNKITQTEGIDTTSLHRCNEMADRVIGEHYHRTPDVKYTEYEPEPDSLAQKILGNLFSDSEFIEEYASLTDKERILLAENTGINEFATLNAEIGTALRTQSIGDYGSLGKWNYHWAGIIAKSGSDIVTLENYNRADENKQTDYLPSSGVDEDKRWFFQIYGQEVGQTFHEKMKETDDFLNPLTTLHLKSEEKQMQQDQERGIEVWSEEQTAAFLQRILGLKDPTLEKQIFAQVMERERKKREKIRYAKIGGTIIVSLVTIVGAILLESYGYTDFI